MRFGRTDDFQAGSLVWVNSEELKELFPAKLVNDPPAELYEDTTLVVEVL